MARFVTTTFSDGPDISLEMGNEEWVRTLSIGSNWTHIRIGILWQIAGTANTPSNTGFAIGMCSGSASPFNSASCTNFVGIYCNSVMGWNAGSGSPFFSFNGGIIVSAKKIGSAITQGSNLSDSAGMYVPTTGGGARRGVLYVDITKGSPNYTVQLNLPPSGTGTSTDFTVPNLLAGLTQSVSAITVGGVLLSPGNSPVTIATDETAGGFDTVDVYSNGLANVMELLEVAVQKLA